MKILNLNEGSFPIDLNFDIEHIDIPTIGRLEGKLSIEAKILKVSKNLLKCDGQLKGTFIDTCQNCLKEIKIDLFSLINVTFKDISELHLDTSDQDQTHYQDLEYFNIETFLDEEIGLIYPDIVKCNDNCIDEDKDLIKEKNLPFKKIRDLMD